MKFDLRACLGWWDIEVRLGDEIFVIPATPASDWMDAILSGDRSRVIPEMVDDPEGKLAEAVLSGRVPWADQEKAAKAALAEAAGVPWWVAGRLTAIACTWDSIGGELLLAGIRADREPLAVVLASAWRLVVKNCDPKKLPELQAKIEAPPPEARTEAEADYDEHEAIANMMAAGSALLVKTYRT